MMANQMKKHNESKEIEKVNFLQVYEEIKKDILENIKEKNLSSEIVEEVLKYYNKCMDHTCIGGKMTRGLAVIKAAEAASIGKTDDYKEGMTQFYKKSAMLGWCVEILQAFFLVADDVMDNSIRRRGKLCWYKLENVTASNAINDTLFLNSTIYFILKKYFRETPEYVSLIETFLECTSKTILGQHLDTNAQRFCARDKNEIEESNQNFDISRVTIDRYRSIVTLKTAYYSFYLPCALGMILAGMKDESLFQSVENVCMQLGEYFQVQDDYLDCFADPVLIGKIGTDIQENKCTWLIIKAVEIAKEEEIEILKASYGRKEKEKVECVKELYRKLNLKQMYKEYEETSKRKIENMIKKVEHEGLQELLNFFLQKIYQREK